MMTYVYLFLCVLLNFICVNFAAASDALQADNASSFFDSHIHYNWDQAEIISTQDIVGKLVKADVGLAIVSSTPAHLALELRQAGGEWIVPFFSPYIHELGKRDWFLNTEVVTQAERGLRQKQYFGIGEVHFMAGYSPGPQNNVFLGLVELAKKFKVPMLIHVDAADEKYFLNICQRHPRVSFVLAHAGGNLYPEHIESIIKKCPNVLIDFAARDPWRYGGLTNEKGHLLSGWKQIVMRYPDRFITGTDPVWRVTRTQSWDQPDDGWDHFEKLLDYHKQWLSDLPKQVQIRITRENVKKLLGK